MSRRLADLELQLGLCAGEVLHAIERLFVTSPEVSRTGFTTFVHPFLDRHPGIQALEWIPRVPALDRARWEAAARADGLEAFQFTERQAHTAWSRRVSARRSRRVVSISSGPVFFCRRLAVLASSPDTRRSSSTWYAVLGHVVATVLANLRTMARWT